MQNFTVGAVDPENPQEAIEQAAAAEESKNGAYLSEKSRSRTFKSSDSEDDGAAAFMEDKKDKGREHVVRSRENSVNDDGSDNARSRIETAKSVSNMGSESFSVSAYKVFLMTTNSRY